MTTDAEQPAPAPVAAPDEAPQPGKTLDAEAPKAPVEKQPDANGKDHPKEDDKPQQNGTDPAPTITDPKEKSDDAKPDEKDSKQEDDDKDQSWYGSAPDEAISKQVSEKLGAEVSDLFIKACRQLDGANDNVNRVLLATHTFVSALNKVVEDQQMTVAFGEISLAYGRALVKYIEIEGSGTTAVAAKIVKALQSAVSGGRTGVTEEEGDEQGDDEGKEAEGDDAKKEDGADAEAENKQDGEEEEIAKDTEKKNGDGDAIITEKAEKEKSKKEGGDDEEEDDSGEQEDLEMAWTQLEVARVIFSREKLATREADCRYTLGKLLLACDEGKQAATEFASAAVLFKESGDMRRTADCHHQHFLAIRNSARPAAAQALRDAVAAMEQVTGADDVLADMKMDLKDFEASIADEQKNADAAAAMPTEVQVVRPKRKRDVVAAEEKKAEEANGNTTAVPTDASNGTVKDKSAAAQPGKDGEEKKNENGDIAMEAAKEDKTSGDGEAKDDGTGEKHSKKARVDEEAKAQVEQQEQGSTGEAAA